MDATTQIAAHLERLRSEFTERGWTAEIQRRPGKRPRLYVRNPHSSRMSDDIVCDDRVFRWSWGQPIGPLTEAPGVAEQIMYVLREVGS
ncbi:hypothetical protein [Actinomadura xylanilytica]|uniref:hypothetical protein n=1 Tax=Actinomadura xylanilytica TaxID=887459 RepID=UPI00255B3562|nr:hypothetical protein [Actinomadura xylanilytica]MDL4773311.1 hypothetical protein [Actinomadura xylanilytica]